ncbi:MAG: methyltransferase [Ruthenibacterium sp.]
MLQAEESPALPPELLMHGTRVAVNAQHKFGADALLLAAFCGAKNSERVCDFGTGCGVIPLRLHDRGHRGVCVAVDCMPAAIGLLQQSVRENAIDHITPICADLRAWRPPCAPDGTRALFDLITCNPPYFTDGPRSPDAAKAVARHEDACTVADVCRAASPVLRDGGRLCVCLRPQRLADVICAMRAVHIEPKRLQFVAARPEKEPWLFLLDGRKNRAPGLRLLPLLITENADGTRPSAALRAVYET